MKLLFKVILFSVLVCRVNCQRSNYLSLTSLILVMRSGYMDLYLWISAGYQPMIIFNICYQNQDAKLLEHLVLLIL